LIPELVGRGTLPRKELKQAAQELMEDEAGLIVVGESTLDDYFEKAVTRAAKTAKHTFDTKTDQLADELVGALKSCASAGAAGALGGRRAQDAAAAVVVPSPAARRPVSLRPRRLEHAHAWPRPRRRAPTLTSRGMSWLLYGVEGVPRDSYMRRSGTA
jgi:hypothetical protein